MISRLPCPNRLLTLRGCKQLFRLRIRFNTFFRAAIALTRLVLLCLFVLLGLATEAVAYPVHYLVFSVDREDKVSLQFYRQVELTAPLQTRREEELQVASEEEETVSLRLRSANGEVVFRGLIRLPQWLRGEFHGDTQKAGGWWIDSRRFPLSARTFAVRVPIQRGATLELDGTAVADFELDTLIKTSATLPLAGLPSAHSVPTHPRRVVQQTGSIC